VLSVGNNGILSLDKGRFHVIITMAAQHFLDSVHILFVNKIEHFLDGYKTLDYQFGRSAGGLESRAALSNDFFDFCK
jgi:hypothetical protein